jgi:hypothetical protein
LLTLLSFICIRIHAALAGWVCEIAQKGLQICKKALSILQKGFARPLQASSTPFCAVERKKPDRVSEMLESWNGFRENVRAAFCLEVYDHTIDQNPARPAR